MNQQQVLEIKGKSIDEAIFNGLQELGVSIDEVSIETVQTGSKGILGFGAKPFVVRLTVRPDDYFEKQAAQKPAERPKPRPEPVFEPKAESKAEPKAEQRTEQRSAPKPEAAAAPRVAPKTPNRGERSQRVQDEPRQEHRSSAHASIKSPPVKSQISKHIPPPVKSGMLPATPAAPRAAEERQSADSQRQQDDRQKRARKPAPKPAPKPPREKETREKEPIVEYEYTPYVQGESECPGGEFLTELLKKIGVEATIGYFISESNVRFRINCESMGVLIGYRGETLDALQYLTGLVVNRNKQEPYVRVTLDTQNYRNKREETLHKLAIKMAAQVRTTQKPVTLEPMNPYERRVLHATLQSNKFVTTFSEGEEPNRRVVIAPKND